MEQTFVYFPELFVKQMLESWMNANSQIFYQLSQFNVWNQHNQQK